MRAEGLDYPGAVEFLARSAGVPLEERQSGGGNRPTVRRERVLDCNREAARLFHAALQSPSGRAGAGLSDRAAPADRKDDSALWHRLRAPTAGISFTAV